MEIGVSNRFQESLLRVAAGSTPGPMFLCPLAPRSVPYPRAFVTIGDLRIDTNAFHRLFKTRLLKTRYPLKRACDPIHTGWHEA